MSPRSSQESQNESQEAPGGPKSGPPTTTGEQLATLWGQRIYHGTTAAGRETPGERAQRASTGLTREQLAPPRGHRSDGKAACTTAKPPASTGKQFATPLGHQQNAASKGTHR